MVLLTKNTDYRHLLKLQTESLCCQDSSSSSATTQGKHQISQHETNNSLIDDPHARALEPSHTTVISRSTQTNHIGQLHSEEMFMRKINGSRRQTITRGYVELRRWWVKARWQWVSLWEVIKMFSKNHDDCATCTCVGPLTCILYPNKLFHI